jgi:uncharacterized coiled-coil protein SlyX
MAVDSMDPERVSELAAVHALASANLAAERLRRVESKQDEQADTLSEMRTMLARIDERTKRFDTIEGEMKALNERVDSCEESINKAKGVGLVGSLLLGCGEILNHFLKGR